MDIRTLMYTFILFSHQCIHIHTCIYTYQQEPDKAVLAYQEARKLEERQSGDRGDSDLAGKIGQAFISSHDFQGACVREWSVGGGLEVGVGMSLYMYVHIYMYAYMHIHICI